MTHETLSFGYDSRIEPSHEDIPTDKETDARIQALADQIDEIFTPELLREVSLPLAKRPVDKDDDSDHGYL